MNLQLFNQNCLEVLKKLPENSIDSVVTDPPYGLGKEPDVVEVMSSWIKEGFHEVKGTSTSVKVCKEYNRNFIGSELIKEYFDMANHKLKSVNYQYLF